MYLPSKKDMNCEKLGVGMSQCYKLDEAFHGEFYYKQNIDYAFLVSFATKLSDYFVLTEDNVFIAPNFVTHIYSRVATMKSNSWVLLEFSNMGFLGKLFHSRDLPLLAHFLLLFYKEKPLDNLISHFHTLLVQESPILCRPFSSTAGSPTLPLITSRRPQDFRKRTPLVPITCLQLSSVICRFPMCISPGRPTLWMSHSFGHTTLV